ncbi:MAG: hypothetical protein H6974_06850 [Gammaproteobacteria bacterium]|nr:hypothetical protein [Gammaproteobacteria bacterium]MCP5196490.1 hypothetical protein [Gammaproteobacteria bacterium]
MHACLEPIGTALRTYTRPTIGLWDPELNAITPLEHYGQLSAALARLILDDPANSEWHQSLDAWLALGKNQIGHLPFNRFMLFLLRDVLSKRNTQGYDLSRITQGLERCVLRRRYPSNNWSLLAQLCRMIEAPLSQRRRQLQKFCHLIDRWTTPAGGFIDFPVRPQRTGSTPMTYHYKALFLATVAAWFQDDPTLTPRLQRLLNWVCLCWDGAGHAGGFGRSTHALFGDGCLLASLVLLGLAGGEGQHGIAQNMADNIIKRLQSQRRADGFYWLNPAGTVADQCGWDRYMALSVYNAWFAAVVAWALHARTTRTTPQCLKAVSSPFPSANEKGGIETKAHASRQSTLLYDDQAGILRMSTESGLTALFSTCGQLPQAFSQNEVELRYSGGIPFHIRIGDKLVVPPPVRVDREALVLHPVLAGWTPVFLIAGRHFGLTDFTQIEVEESKDAYSIKLQGHPVALYRRPANAFWPKLRATLDWRLFGGAWGRQEALRRDCCDTILGTIRARLDKHMPCLSIEICIQSKQDIEAIYLNPVGHTLTENTLPCTRKLISLSPNNGRQLGMAIDAKDDEWIAMSIPSAIAPAKGFCLAPFSLPSGIVGYSLKLEWLSKKPPSSLIN